MILTTNTTYAARYPERDAWATVISEDAVFPIREGEYVVAAQIEEPTPAGRRHAVVHIIDGDAVIARFCLSRQQAVAAALARYDAQG